MHVTPSSSPSAFSAASSSDALLPGELRSVSGRGHAVSGRCTAHVRSGIPPSETLFTVRRRSGPALLA